MTLKKLHHIKIYKIILILFIVLIVNGKFSLAEAIEFGEVKYNNALIDYSVIDKDTTLKSADYFFDKALKADEPDEKKEYLKKAGGEYFILTRIEPGNLYPMVQLARVYDLENENSYAKAYFFSALNIEKDNPATNYYFGEYYYARNDYRRAIHYYNKAFDNGYKENYDVIIKMAIMYEKLGDLLRSNQYYKKALLVKPENTEIPEKIRQLEAVKYQQTGYYNRRRRK